MAKIGVDKKMIAELATLLEENNLAEIEIEEEGRRIRLSRGTVMQAAPAAYATAPAALPGNADAAAGDAGEDLSAHPGAVTSPMVGTVYLAPAPEADPFVQIGDQVSEGQTLLIVEAMKTMNPIPAPKSGKVAHILISNADPVEFGEVLAIIE